MTRYRSSDHVAMKLVTVGAVLMLVAGLSHAQADEARAKKIIGGSCFLCHGAEGESASEVFPRLAGQNAEYIAKQLENFKVQLKCLQMTTTS